MIYASNSDLIPVPKRSAAEIIQFARERQKRFEAQARDLRRIERELKEKQEKETRVEDIAKAKAEAKAREAAERRRAAKAASDKLDTWMAQQRKQNELAAAMMRKELGIGYRPDLATIIRRMCKAYGVTGTELMSRRRRPGLVMARQAVMYWAVRLTSMSYPQIARRLGDRDHTTCLHGARVYPEKRANMGRRLRPVR